MFIDKQDDSECATGHANTHTHSAHRFRWNTWNERATEIAIGRDLARIVSYILDLFCLVLFTFYTIHECWLWCGAAALSIAVAYGFFSHFFSSLLTFFPSHIETQLFWLKWMNSVRQPAVYVPYQTIHLHAQEKIPSHIQKTRVHTRKSGRCLADPE